MDPGGSETGTLTAMEHGVAAARLTAMEHGVAVARLTATEHGVAVADKQVSSFTGFFHDLTRDGTEWEGMSKPPISSVAATFEKGLDWDSGS
jgi:hypothetical protein